jgi:hypothetical protein
MPPIYRSSTANGRGDRFELSTAGVIANISAMHPPTMDFPVTFIQEHINAKETVKLYVSRQSRGR